MGSRRGWRATASGCVGAAVALLSAAPAAGASSVTYLPSSFGSSITVTGEADDDVVTVSADGATVTIADQGTGGVSTVDADCANAGANAVTCPLDPPDPALPASPTAPVLNVTATLSDGTDFFSGPAPFFFGVNGGGGDDVVSGGPREDNLDGGEGNDQVLGREGNDQVGGGGGAFGAGGTDLLDGEAGVDTALFGRQVGVEVSLNGQPDDGFPGEGDNAITENVQTGSGNDVVTGSPQANELSTSSGNDLVRGLEGNDVLSAGSGDDGLDGGAQRDALECDEGFDVALLDRDDVGSATCERDGAEIAGGTATVDRRSRTRIEVSCPLEEANPCAGKVVLLAGSKELGAGRFQVAAGESRRAKAKLNKAGRKLLARNGGTALAIAEARTEEPIGTSASADEVLLRRARGGKGRA